MSALGKLPIAQRAVVLFDRLLAIHHYADSELSGETGDRLTTDNAWRAVEGATSTVLQQVPSNDADVLVQAAVAGYFINSVVEELEGDNRTLGLLIDKALQRAVVLLGRQLYEVDPSARPAVQALIDHAQRFAGPMPARPVAATEAAAAWAAAQAIYDAARGAERHHHAEFIAPLFDESLPVGPARNAAINAVPDHLWDQNSVLIDARVDAEDVLLKLPSPHAAAFALKVHICRAEDRDLNGLDDMLVAEAEAIIAGALS